MKVLIFVLSVGNDVVEGLRSISEFCSCQCAIALLIISHVSDGQ
jgi:hypothetical protein